MAIYGQELKAFLPRIGTPLLRAVRIDPVYSLGESGTNVLAGISSDSVGLFLSTDNGNLWTPIPVLQYRPDHLTLSKLYSHDGLVLASVQ
jgi:hypothetical protein